MQRAVITARLDVGKDWNNHSWQCSEQQSWRDEPIKGNNRNWSWWWLRLHLAWLLAGLNFGCSAGFGWHAAAPSRSAACRTKKKKGQLSELLSAVLQRYEALLRIKIIIVNSLVTVTRSLGAYICCATALRSSASDHSNGCELARHGN